MKNILFFIGKYPNVGGAERITTILANSFVGQGDTVSILSCQSCGTPLSMGLDKRVKMETLPFGYPFPTFSNLRFLKKYIVNNHIDIIVNQWCVPFYITYLFNRARANTDCALISVLHSIPNRSRLQLSYERKILNSNNFFTKNYWKLLNRIVDAILRRSMLWVYKQSDRYVVLSERYITIVKQYASLKSTNKLVAIGNPVTIKISHNFSPYLGTKCKQVLYVGRIDKEDKRVDRIIQVWANIFRRVPDWSLLLVGDGPSRVELETYVKNNGIDRVKFAGFVDAATVKHYEQSSILLLTSDMEGFGLVVVEAMAFGVIPVVYGSYEAVFDIITHGRDGFITHKPFEIQEMSDLVLRLIRNEDERLIMSRNAIEKSKQFYLDSIVCKWKEMFNCLFC